MQIFYVAHYSKDTTNMTYAPRNKFPSRLHLGEVKSNFHQCDTVTASRSAQFIKRAWAVFYQFPDRVAPD